MEILEDLPIGIARLDARGRITHANRRLREWFSLLPACIKEAAASETCVACGDRGSELCHELRAYAAGGSRLPIVRRVQLQGGPMLEVRCEPLYGQEGYSLVVEDATEKLQHEFALQQANERLAELLAERSRELLYSREFLRSLIETNRDLMLSVDAQGIITFTNKGFVGAAAGALVGKSLGGLVAERHREEFAGLLGGLLAGNVPHVLFEAEGNERLEHRWCLFSMGPLRSDGAVNGLTAIVSDLTALREAWDRVRSNEKLVATGRMAARIAHEINNPLTGISGAIQLIKADLPAGSSAARYTEMVEREISRISNVMRQMYGIYRPEQEVARITDLRPVLDEVVTLMRTDAAHRKVVLRSGVTAPEFVLVQEQNLRQILINIIRNAIEVTVPGGVVEVSVERRPGCVDVVVVDQGPGITDELRQQMFEPFFSTKSASGGRGLGLGLSISDTLVKAMGGLISFENAAGGGARCRICLPEAVAARANRPA